MRKIGGATCVGSYLKRAKSPRTKGKLLEFLDPGNLTAQSLTSTPSRCSEDMAWVRRGKRRQAGGLAGRVCDAYATVVVEGAAQSCDIA